MKKTTLVLLLACMAPLLASADFILVASKDNALTKVSMTALRNIYKGKATKIGNISVIPLLRKPYESSPAEAFLKEVVQKTPDKYKKFWLSEAIKGGAREPESMKNAEELIQKLSTVSEAIGFVSKKELGELDPAVRAKIKVIDINP